MMTVADLIEYLSDLPEDAEMRLVTQPSYPLAGSLKDGLTFDGETGKVWLFETHLPRDENPYETPEAP